MEHFRQVPEYSFQSQRIDRENGIIYGLKVLQKGRNKNDSYFDDKLLDDYVEMANAKPEGVKCRYGHPNMCSSDFGNYLGRQKDNRRVGDDVLADLYLSESAKNTPNGDLYTYTLDMAEENPDMFGNSISVMGDFEEVEIDEKTEYVLKLEGVEGSDLVGSPAATDSLFDSDDIGVKLTQFLDFSGAALFKALEKNPKSIEIFEKKFKAYVAKKYSKDMAGKNNALKILSGIKKGFAQVFDFDKALADGEIATVETDDQEIAEGAVLKDEDGDTIKEDVVTSDGDEVKVDEATGEVESVEEAEEDNELPTSQEFGYMLEQSKENAKAIEGFNETFSALNDTLSQVLKNQEEFAKRIDFIGKGLESPEAEDFTAEKRVMIRLHALPVKIACMILEKRVLIALRSYALRRSLRKRSRLLRAFKNLRVGVERSKLQRDMS